MAKGILSENEKQFIAALKEKGKPEQIKKFLNLGDIRTDCLDEHGMTPLCHAAYRGYAEICSLLLLRGANPSSHEHDSRYTPLMFAVMSGSVETVHILMAAGADSDYENNTGRTAAQLAGFISQHECAIVINSYVRRQDIDYFTIPRGFDTEPKLPPRLAAPLHRFLLQTNLNLFWLANHLLSNADARVLVDSTNYVHVSRVIDSLIERECKSQELNEMRAMKIHYLGSIMQMVVQETGKTSQNGTAEPESTADSKPEWLRNFVRPTVQDQFAKRTIGNFPYHDLALLRQLVHQIKTAPPQTRFSTAMSALLVSIGGRMYDRISSSEACGTCGSHHAEKQCSKCHSVVYCNADCQRIHWNVHKKFCKDEAEESSKPIKDDHPYSKFADGKCPFSSGKMGGLGSSSAPSDASFQDVSVCPVSGKSAAPETDENVTRVAGEAVVENAECAQAQTCPCPHSS